MSTRTHSKRRVPRWLAMIVITSVASLSTHALFAQSTTVSASDAWVREAVGPRKVTAVFVTLANTSTTARSIISGSTDVADTLELHEMVRNGTEMRMSPVTSIEIPASGKAELKPGGLHLMLFGLKRPLAAGDSIHVTLTLDDGQKVSFGAEVRKPRPMP